MIFPFKIARKHKKKMVLSECVLSMLTVERGLERENRRYTDIFLIINLKWNANYYANKPKIIHFISFT